MENPGDWQDLSQWRLARIGEKELSSLLRDPQTEEFHSWLFDILMDFELHKRAAKEIQSNPQAKILETLVNQCHDVEVMSPETGDFRKSVLRILYLKLDVHWLAALVSGKRHKEAKGVIKQLLEELRKRRREERRKRRKNAGYSLEADDDDDDASEFDKTLAFSTED